MIKKLEAADAAAVVELSELVYDTCLRGQIRYPELNTYFEEYMTEAGIAERMRQGTLHVWGAVEGNLLFGAGALTEDGQITMLYVHPDYQHKKYGRDLLQTIRRYAAVELNLPQVYVNAAPARTGSYFISQGFGRIDIRQTPDSPFMTLTAETLYLKEYPVRQVPGGVIAGIVCGFILLSFLILFGYSAFFNIMH